MKQLTISASNRPGVLAEIATLLGTSGVNIETIAAETFGENAIIRLLTNDSSSARTALQRTPYRVSEHDMLIIGILDRPGELGKVARKLSENHINIENIFLLGKKENKAVLALKVDRQPEAAKVIRDYLEH